MPTIPTKPGHHGRPSQSTLSLWPPRTRSRPHSPHPGQPWLPGAVWVRDVPEPPSAPHPVMGRPGLEPHQLHVRPGRASSLLLAIPCSQKAQDTVLVGPSVSCSLKNAVPPWPWQQNPLISCPHVPLCQGSWPWDGRLHLTKSRAACGVPQLLRSSDGTSTLLAYVPCPALLSYCLCSRSRAWGSPGAQDH